MPSFRDIFYPTVAAAGSATIIYRQMACAETVSVGDLVYPSQTEVDTAISCVSNTHIPPAIGIVNSKPTTTACNVLQYGKYDTPILGLIAPNFVFLGVDGAPTTTVPGTGYIQVIGYCEIDNSFYCTALNTGIRRVKRTPFI